MSTASIRIIREVEEKLGKSLALPEHEDEFDTAAGLATALAALHPGLAFTIDASAGRHVAELRWTS